MRVDARKIGNPVEGGKDEIWTIPLEERRENFMTPFKKPCHSQSSRSTHVILGIASGGAGGYGLRKREKRLQNLRRDNNHALCS